MKVDVFRCEFILNRINPIWKNFAYFFPQTRSVVIIFNLNLKKKRVEGEKKVVERTEEVRFNENYKAAFKIEIILLKNKIKEFMVSFNKSKFFQSNLSSPLFSFFSFLFPLPSPFLPFLFCTTLCLFSLTLVPDWLIVVHYHPDSLIQ